MSIEDRIQLILRKILEKLDVVEKNTRISVNAIQEDKFGEHHRP